MRRAISLAAFVATGCAAAAPAPPRADAAHPVVVELFQSQGCSSCPPAGAAVNAIAGRADVLALNFGVTYWDRLGWKDSFAAPAYTARQWDYARRAGRANVATPQVIVNGRTAINGGNRVELAATIAAAGAARGGPALSASAGTVRVAAGPTQPAAGTLVWLVRYDPAVRNVAIRAGENGGRTLPHRDVVRQLVLLGTWRGPALALPLPPPVEPHLATAVIAQAGIGGAITGALKL